ncbi:MAG: DeoR/GlpR family DNA-binding transcription regulator [Opitutales bacterium]
MIAQERQNQIVDLLERNGTVRTLELAEKFQVTDETIRRDLQILSDDGLLTRVHGGASSLSGRPKLRSFTERQTLHVEQKEAIAERAAGLIEAGQTYAFDSSTTVFELVRRLPDLPYRVVTNAYAVVDQLILQNQVELILTGGRYHPKTQTFIGGDSYRSIQRHNINVAFLSCIGIDLQRGVSEGFEEQAIFKEALMQMAEQTVLLVDSTKLDKRSEYFFGHLKQITHIITDSDADPVLLDHLRSAGCSVLVAEAHSSSGGNAAATP